MFNNAAFDVVLGMTLIYLLYSLLVTIVGEMVATWMALRSRILRVAIEKMLNDGYWDAEGKKRYNSWWNFLQRYFLKEFEGFKDSFAGRFYAQASVKSLSGNVGSKNTYFSQTKPSYISDTNFADTLSSMLTEKGVGQTLMEKVNYCLKHNICHIQPQTLAFIQRLSNDAGNDIDAFKTKLKNWFNETNDRATGWYKRKLQLILFWLGFIIAAAFNVDSIQIARFLAKDKDARKDLANMAIAQASDSLRYAVFIDGKGDTLHSKNVLDSGLAMAKKDIKEANMILGVGWGLDTLTKKCSICFTEKKDSAEYASLKQYNKLLNDSVGAFRQVDATVLNLRKKIAREKTKIQGLLSFIENKTAQQVFADTIKVMQDSLSKSQRQSLEDSLQLAGQQSRFTNLDTIINGALQNIRFLTSRQLVSITKIDSSKAGVLKVQGKCTYNWLEKTWYVICQAFSKPLRLLGFIITALMLSLGAPFWFDLLKKLVSLRGSGVKPEEKKPKATDGTEPQNNNGPFNNLVMPTSAPAGANNVADTDEQALENVTQKLQSQPGVLGVGLRAQPNSTPPQMVVEVMVINDATATLLQQQIGDTETLANGNTVNIIYTVTTANVSQGAMMGSEISNKSGALGQGTLGCFLKKDGDNNTYLLSCWHVLKDNTDWNAAPLQKTVVDSSGNQIGSVVDGCLTDTIDVGIATYTTLPIDKNPQITITAQQRPVKTFDALMSTPVKLFGKVSKFQQAQIFHHKINVQLEYPDNMMHSFTDIFSISVKDTATGKFIAPTSDGDSGAVVTDMNGVPLGMIIGGNNIFSYAVKFTNIFNPDAPYKDYSFIINA